MAPRPRKIPLVRRWLTARGRSLEISKGGWLFILLTIAVGFAAINSGSNLLHAVFGAQMTLFLGNALLSEAMVKRTRATRTPDSALHAETPGTLRVELHNTHASGDVFSVSVEDDDRVLGAGESTPVFCVRIPAGGSVTLHSTVTLERRGTTRLPPAVVATRFPFGLFIKRRDLPQPPEVLVYPRIHEVPLAHEAANLIPPELLSKGAGTGRKARIGEFFGLRDYREDDELRHIHWPATARRGRPIVREHEAEGEREIVLGLGAGKSGVEAFEREVEDVASLAVALLRRGDVAVGLDYAGERVVEPGAGPEQRHKLLEFLALAGEPP
jgi:uncharacterized protein (DUF58 family)